MARRPSTRSTVIYWLVDTRTGVPFYCGKTVCDPSRRLSQHRCTAVNSPNRPISVAIASCGENIRIDIMEVVPADGDWSAREKFWISTLRLINPNCCNTNAGGSGCSGLVHSPESRAKMSRAALKRSDETRAKISAALRGRKMTSESIEKGAAARRGRKMSAETRVKMSLAKLGKKLSSEHIEKISAFQRGKVVSAETRAKMSIAQRARVLTLEHIEAIREAQRKRRERERSLLTKNMNVIE